MQNNLSLVSDSSKLCENKIDEGMVYLADVTDDISKKINNNTL